MHNQILALMEVKAKEPHDYINPNFLQDITGLIWDYYGVENDIVNDWVVSMFGD